MLVWIIILALLVLILAFPVGVDAAYDPGAYFLKLKLGPFRLTLLPRKKPGKKKEKPEKPNSEEAPQEQPKKKEKMRFTLDDILTLAEIGLDAIRRFCRHLSIDRFLLYWTAAARDPYAAVLQYGRVNAILGTLSAKARSDWKVRNEDVQTSLDLEAAKPVIRTRLVMSIQIWEILLVGVCAGWAGARWIIRKKRNERNERAAAADATERSIKDGEL